MKKWLFCVIIGGVIGGYPQVAMAGEALPVNPTKAIDDVLSAPKKSPARTTPAKTDKTKKKKPAQPKKPLKKRDKKDIEKYKLCNPC